MLRGEMLDAMMRDTVAKFLDSSWSQAPDTETSRSQLFEICTRPASVVFQLLRARLQIFPYRLMALLESRTLATARELLAIPVCMRDELATYFLDKYPTPELLANSDDAWQSLHAMASTLECTTFAVECLHAGNTRRSKSVTHTHRKHLSNVALHHAACAAPAVLGRPLPQSSQPRKKTRGRPRKRKLAACANDEDEGNDELESGAPALKRRGGGGAWRAFVHHQVHHLGEPCDFGALAVRYRMLEDGERDFYEQLGSQGLSTQLPETQIGLGTKHLL